MPLLLVVLADCRRHADAKAIAKPPPAGAEPEVWTRPALANRTAFDLTLGRDGAVLLWSPPAARGGGIVARLLDAHGAPRGDARTLAKTLEGSEAVELAAAFVATGVGVAWIESTASTSVTRSLRLDPDGRAAAEPVVLSSVATPATPARGRIAVAGDQNGSLRIIYPTGPSECIEASVGPCTGFAFRELGTAPPQRPREPWLSVPQPCATGTAALGALPGHWFYALCTWTGEAPATTAYSIQMEPSYARADKVLEGCTLIGMTRIDPQALLLIGDCGPVRRAVRLGLSMTPPAELVLQEPSVRCTADGAVVSGSGWSLPLDAPRDRLEALLPPALAPDGSRAVFTGQALLVAEPTAAGLQLRSHSCSDGELRSR